MVDLKLAVDSAKGEISTIEMEGTKQPIAGFVRHHNS